MSATQRTLEYLRLHGGGRAIVALAEDRLDAIHDCDNPRVELAEPRKRQAGRSRASLSQCVCCGCRNIHQRVVEHSKLTYGSWRERLAWRLDCPIWWHVLAHRLRGYAGVAFTDLSALVGPRGAVHLIEDLIDPGEDRFDQLVQLS
jgi:hypothetical protein